MLDGLVSPDPPRMRSIDETSRRLCHDTVRRNFEQLDHETPAAAMAVKPVHARSRWQWLR